MCLDFICFEPVVFTTDIFKLFCERIFGLIKKWNLYLIKIDYSKKSLIMIEETQKVHEKSILGLGFCQIGSISFEKNMRVLDSASKDSELICHLSQTKSELQKKHVIIYLFFSPIYDQN